MSNGHMIFSEEENAIDRINQSHKEVEKQGWEIFETTQNKMREIETETDRNQAISSGKSFDKWDKYISTSNNQPSQEDLQHQQTIKTNISANAQSQEMERWKLLEDTQTDALDRQQKETVDKGKTEDKKFGKYNEYIRGSVDQPRTTMVASAASGEGYQVGSYDDMDDGVRTVKTMGEDLHTELASNDSMTYLKQDRAFIGPIADHFFDVADLYNKTTDNNISDLESNSRTLAQINTNYQNTDAEAQSKMGGLVA